MIRIAVICSVIIFVISTGCTHTTQHGDATLVYREGTWASAPSYTLKLPGLDLSRQHSCRFEVRDLPVSIFAVHWDFPTSDEEAALRYPLLPGSTAWADAVVELAIHEADGPSLYASQHRLGDIANVGSSLNWGIQRRGGGFFRLGDNHESLPELLSYDLVVSVRHTVPRSPPLVLTGHGMRLSPDH